MTILSSESIKDIDLLVNEISFFRMIILKADTLFGKIKVLSELKKYRGFNFDRFLEDTNQFLEQEKKDGLSSTLKNEYLPLETKFHESNGEYTARFKEKICELEAQITALYFS